MTLRFYISLVVCALVLMSCQRVAHAEQQATTSVRVAVRYELPQVVDRRPQQVIEHTGFALSYNPRWLDPRRDRRPGHPE